MQGLLGGFASGAHWPEIPGRSVLVCIEFEFRPECTPLLPEQCFEERLRSGADFLFGQDDLEIALGAQRCLFAPFGAEVGKGVLFSPDAAFLLGTAAHGAEGMASAGRFQARERASRLWFDKRRGLRPSDNSERSHL